MYCTKSRTWSYEREWRAIHLKAGTLFAHSDTDLKAIYFGPKIDPLALDILCTVLAGQNRGVEYWVGSLNKDAFKVEFEQKPYTPYIVAKERGLMK